MSNKIYLGDRDLEHTLPSWVSNHLGGKSYITDDITPSPLSPIEGSHLGNSFVYTEHLEMDTSSLLKENNIMTLGNLNKLREKYSFPSGVQLRIPGEGETILSARPGEARPEKNLLRGSLSNVKGWKKRFFFASRDEWEFFPSMPPGDGIPRVPRSWGAPGIIYNKLSALIEDEAKRTAEVFGKIGPGLILSGSIEYLGVIREDIGRVARRAFPNIPDLTLLRWLGGKVRNPFSNLFPSDSSISSDSRSESLSDSGLAPEFRSDGPRASMMSSAPTARKILNGVILPADKEKVYRFTTDELVTKSFHALGQAVVLISTFALWSQDHQNYYHFQLARTDSTELKMVKAQNRASQAESQLVSLGEEVKKAEAELKAKFEAMAWLEAEDAVTDSGNSYFGEGFEFCKRKLLHQHPNLGVDVESMEMDGELAKEEKAAKTGEKEEDNETNPTP
ncbi:hypothetical protein Acr_00g0051010 [Actinidia rufa]|uniref:Uncharacterized protein n=1 Tax=Actinidia rufa TaxID=165716 RepID=A0A7J0DKN2_9ERIC|nr:hypothetical protein Acr_00g0051010 [Actinidia rufa]